MIKKIYLAHQSKLYVDFNLLSYWRVHIFNLAHATINDNGIIDIPVYHMKLIFSKQ